MRLRCLSLLGAGLILILWSCGSQRNQTNPPVSPVPSEPSESQPSPVPPESSPLPPSGGIVDQQQFMIFHNLKRCWHDSPKIKWSESLYQKAKAIADKCDFNYEAPALSTGHGEGLDVIKALDQWYLEGMIWFPYGKNDIPEGMGRFAAMIWKDTKEMGCATVDCTNEPYFVCAYSGEVDKAKAASNVSGLKPDFLTCTGM
jgi:hypothetical protein